VRTCSPHRGKTLFSRLAELVVLMRRVPEKAARTGRATQHVARTAHWELSVSRLGSESGGNHFSFPEKRFFMGKTSNRTGSGSVLKRALMHEVRGWRRYTSLGP